MKLLRMLSAISLFCSAALALPPAPITVGPSPVHVVEGYITNMNLYAQTQSQWCWAGVTETISSVVGKAKSECKMASRFIKGTPGDYCCQAAHAGTSECNKPYFLDKSLGFYKMLDQMFANQISTLNIIQDLKKRLPVGVRIGWDNGGGHFLVLYGAKYVGKVQTFNLWNPLPLGKGDKQIVNRSALTRYQNAGNWTHSYTTKKAG